MSIIRMVMPSYFMNDPPSFEVTFKGVSPNYSLSPETEKALAFSKIPDILEHVGPFGVYRKNGTSLSFDLNIPTLQDIRDYLVSFFEIILLESVFTLHFYIRQSLW